MDLFVIDTKGDTEYLQNDSAEENAVKSPEEEESESDCEDDDFGGLPPPSKDISHIIREIVPKKQTTLPILKKNKQSKGHQLRVKDDKEIDEIICEKVEKQVKPKTKNIETQKNLERVTMTNRKLVKLRKAERANTKGDGWFGMKAPEVTEEVKHELELIRMRKALDNKRFYKRSEAKTLPKFFQIGKVLPSPLDHFQERNQRPSKSLVDDLLADAEFQKRNKRKYREIMENKKSSGYYKAQQKMKKLKKRK